MFKIKKNINIIFGVIFAISIIYTYGFLAPLNYENKVNDIKIKLKNEK